MLHAGGLLHTSAQYGWAYSSGYFLLREERSACTGRPQPLPRGCRAIVQPPTPPLGLGMQGRASSIGLRSPLRCESYRTVRAPRATASSASARPSCLPYPPPAQLPAARRMATPRRTMGRQAYASYMSGIRHARLHARAHARACACARVHVHVRA